MSKILFVVTGADHWTLKDGTKHPTGFWAEEFATPYEAFTKDGHEVVVATPGGVQPVPDQASLTPEIHLPEITPIRLEDVRPADYDAVFYPGGHGPMEDLAVNADSGRLIADTLASGKPLGVVCHGPAALLATPQGTVAGYELTGFTNAEERIGGLADRAKWLLQDRLEDLGADFQEGEPWAPHVVVDRNLVTGQNPASSGPLAAELLEMLD
ncbi:type 1 glutamine amidotransferase domain-containing protein [Nonomuraea sediminis]|uniref:type 1 glutamine amidotransferase domain-containing protein n=1 Tax=Nonomuraea sediminis TaxID=2835864 RepID=UPI001BDCB809|nr:type 1 glutamine amidotransferase domain-containing protein [Nonomuraea sediminis]